MGEKGGQKTADKVSCTGAEGYDDRVAERNPSLKSMRNEERVPSCVSHLWKKLESVTNM